MQLDVNGKSTTNSQIILPDTFYFNNQNHSFANSILRHRANGSYEIKFDSTSSLKITADGGTDHKITNDQYYSEALSKDSTLVNNSNRNTANTTDIDNVNSNILWRKKLAKKGRTISININERYNKTSSTGLLHANNNYYIEGSLSQNQVIDQYKDYQSENLAINSRVTYSEPLSKTSAFIVNYGMSIDNSSSNRNSYNKGNDGKYSQFDSVYSNDYKFNVFTQSGGLNYNLIKKKLRFNAGTQCRLHQF